MMDGRLLLFPISGALIGWLAGYILFKIIVGMALNQKRRVIVEEIADYASVHLVSADQIMEKIAKPEHFLKLMPVIEQHIDEFLRHRLKTAIPMIGMLIGERTISQLKTVFMQELEIILPQVLDNYISDLGQHFDPRQALVQKLLDTPPATFEKAISPLIKKLCLAVGIAAGLSTGVANLLIYLFIR